jgi:hypothetical protein
MRNGRKSEWENIIVDPAQVMKKLESGMSIFLGTGVGEPRTLVKHLMSADSAQWNRHLRPAESESRPQAEYPDFRRGFPQSFQHYCMCEAETQALKKYIYTQ